MANQKITPQNAAAIQFWLSTDALAASDEDRPVAQYLYDLMSRREPGQTVSLADIEAYLLRVEQAATSDVQRLARMLRIFFIGLSSRRMAGIKAARTKAAAKQLVAEMALRGRTITYARAVAELQLSRREGAV